MSFLLRVALPDVPGSLGKVASAIGEAGADIDAIEIVEHRADGSAVDDVLLDVPSGTMPDSIVSACNRLAGVEVLWISRYAAGGNLFLDLEAVEELTADPEKALDRMVQLTPAVFRTDWGARVRLTGDGGEVLSATDAAPDRIPPVVGEVPGRFVTEDGVTLACVVPLNDGEAVLVGRRGGPEFLDSEVARLRHLAALAASIARPGS